MKFSEVELPAIAGVVREKTAKEAICTIKNCELKGATVIDLHLSTLVPEDRTVESIKSIVKSTRLPILALNYSKNYDYSSIPDVTEEERVGLLKTAAMAGVAAIDIQGYTFDKKSKSAFYGDRSLPFAKEGIKELVTDEETIARQTALIDELHSMGCEVLLSNHPGIVMNADEVLGLAKYVEKRKPDVLKIVTVAKSEEDAVEGMRAMLMLKKELNCKVSYHLQGEHGRMTRLINPLLGGFMMFCVDGYGVNNLTAQLDLATAADIVQKYKRLI